MGRIFFTGLPTVLPVVATIYFLVWLIVIAVALVFGVGVLMREYFFSRLFRQLERVLLGVPLVRSVYGALRDMLGSSASSRARISPTCRRASPPRARSRSTCR